MSSRAAGGRVRRGISGRGRPKTPASHPPCSPVMCGNSIGVVFTADSPDGSPKSARCSRQTSGRTCCGWRRRPSLWCAQCTKLDRGVSGRFPVAEAEKSVEALPADDRSGLVEVGWRQDELAGQRLMVSLLVGSARHADGEVAVNDGLPAGRGSHLGSIPRRGGRGPVGRLPAMMHGRARQPGRRLDAQRIRAGSAGFGTTSARCTSQARVGKFADGLAIEAEGTGLLFHDDIDSSVDGR
jgi:hypothetical protein